MTLRALLAAGVQLVFATFSVLALSTFAQAAGLITFVAANGNDANPCTVQTAPCKTLQRAYTAASINGTVKVLSPIQGSLFIAKSITIEGNGETIVGTIIVSSASAVVTLRGLVLNGGNAFVNGIRIDSAAAVHIVNCTIERYTSDGIKLVATTATKLFVSNTVARANSSDGLYADDLNAHVVIQNSSFEQNFSSGVYLSVAFDKANITDSVASGNGQNGFILVSGGARITETVADNNGVNGFSVRASGFIILDSAKTNGNGAAGLQIDTGAFAQISNCVFSDHGGISLFSVNNQGSLDSYQNNEIYSSTGNPFRDITPK